MIRPAESDADVDRWLAIRNEVFPAIAMSRRAVDVQDHHRPEGCLKLLAGDVGFAIATRLLERRGFREVSRQTSLELDLRDVPPVGPAPAGIELVPVPLDSPRFEDVYELEVEAARDIPGEEDVQLPPFDAWLEELEADGEPVALGALLGDDLVGMAILTFPPEQPGVVWHWMTAVRSSHRCRGIGRAIKHASLQTAVERGATTARTFNESRNVGMRRINDKFGFTRRPDLIRWEGPCSS